MLDSETRTTIQAYLIEALRLYIIYCNDNNIEANKDIKRYFISRMKELSDIEG